MTNVATASVAAAFNIVQSVLAPAVQAGTYKRRTAAAYSTTTGVATDSFAAAIPVQVSLQEYARDERTGQALQSEDRKALIQGAQLAADPAIGDQIVVGGQTLDVVGIDPSTDPAKVVWVLQVRRPA